MNRKGHIPTILLFLVCLFLVVLALFSFASFSDSFAENSEGRNEILANVDFYENYIIKESEIMVGGLIRDGGGSEELMRIAKQKNLEIKGLENYFGKIGRGEFKYYWDGEKYRFEMSNVLIYAENGANRIERKFDIKLEFDDKGNLIKKDL